MRDPSGHVAPPVVAWLAGAVLALTLAGCGDAGGSEPGHTVPGGDPERGKATIAAFGCGSCHEIPGVEKAVGVVGPPLIRFGRRVYIAGAVTNTPEHLITWLTVPQSIEPGTAMPNLGLTDGEARDIAAYLYTLR